MSLAMADILSPQTTYTQAKGGRYALSMKTGTKEGLNALVIDDDSEDVAIIVSALEEDGNIADIAALNDGADVTRLLDEDHFRPDVIFLDLNMPRTNGFDVLDIIRSRDMLGRLPIVILTTSHNSTDMRAAFQGLASSYVIKPDSHSVLKAKLAQISTCIMNGEYLDRYI